MLIDVLPAVPPTLGVSWRNFSLTASFTAASNASLKALMFSNVVSASSASKKSANLAGNSFSCSTSIEVLQEKELPAKFADFLLAEDAETTLENINAFKEAFDAAVNEAVKEKLRQDTPRVGGTAGSTSISIKDLAQKHRVIK